MKNHILVTGGSGLVGSALKEIMPEATYLTSKDYDLTIQSEVERMYFERNPDIVIHLAALVSGISDNIKRPADHFTQNVLMNTLVIDGARKQGVLRFIAMLSTCAYADVSKTYPIKETQIYEGTPTETNFAYGFSKRMAAVQIEATNKQYGTNYQYMIPCNIYGKNDNYSIDRSHFIGALIRKIHEAKLSNRGFIELMGTGCSIRQFIYANDVANIIKHFVDNDIIENVNLANDEAYTIDTIARIALSSCDANNLLIEYNEKMPNGQYRKDCDNSKLKQLMPDIQFTKLEDGLKEVYEHYKKNL